MIVGREQLVVLEEFAKRQEQIYPDSCDWGYRWIEGPIGMQEVNRLRDAVAELVKTFKTKAGKWGDNRNGGKYAEFFVPYEQDAGQYSGVLVNVTTTFDRKRRVTYTTIEFRQHRQVDAGFRGE